MAEEHTPDVDEQEDPDSERTLHDHDVEPNLTVDSDIETVAVAILEHLGTLDETLSRLHAWLEGLKRHLYEPLGIRNGRLYSVKRDLSADQLACLSVLGVAVERLLYADRRMSGLCDLLQNLEMQPILTEARDRNEAPSAMARLIALALADCRMQTQTLSGIDPCEYHP